LSESIKQHKLTMVPLSEIRSDPENPNVMTADQMEALRKDLKEFGYLQPIILDQHNMVADGEHRLQVFKELGLEKVPCIVVELRTDEDRRLLRQTMNKLHGTHDRVKDAEELKAIYDAGGISHLAELIGQDRSTIINQLSKYYDIPSIKEDEQPKIRHHDPRIKRGEVFQVGRHKVMCGDATNKKDQSKLLGDVRPKLFCPDPPYNIGYGYNEYADKVDEDKYVEFVQGWFPLTDRAEVSVVTPGPNNLTNWLKRWPPKDMAIWIKRNTMSSSAVFHLKAVEPIFLYGDLPKGARLNDVFEYLATNPSPRMLMIEQSVLPKGQYAPALPVRMWSEFMQVFSKPGDAVLDCFLGSGTSLLAAEQTGRVGYFSDIDPRYCEVSIRRWEQLTGKQAKRLG